FAGGGGFPQAPPAGADRTGVHGRAAAGGRGHPLRRGRSDAGRAGSARGRARGKGRVFGRRVGGRREAGVSARAANSSARRFSATRTPTAVPWAGGVFFCSRRRRAAPCTALRGTWSGWRRTSAGACPCST